MLRDLVAVARPTRPWRLHLQGHSMSPTIREGDELLVIPQTGKPRLGDVVVFAHGEILVAHRVISAGARLLTAGDASRGACEHVESDDVLGTVAAIRRCGRILRSDPRSLVKALTLRVRLALRYYLRVRR